jgi:hypothetical protein
MLKYIPNIKTHMPKPFIFLTWKKKFKVKLIQISKIIFSLRVENQTEIICLSALFSQMLSGKQNMEEGSDYSSLGWGIMFMCKDGP